MARLLIRPELTLTIPPSLLASLGWDEATLLALEVVDGALMIRADTPRPAEAPSPAQAGPPAPALAPAELGQPGLQGTASDVLSTRIELGLTRSELALACGEDYAVIAAWEEGRTQPTEAQRQILERVRADPEAARELARESQPLFKG